MIAVQTGVERCVVCGLCAGASVFAPYGERLPTPAEARARVGAPEAGLEPTEAPDLSLCLPAVALPQSAAADVPESRDDALVRLWLHGRADRTASSYARNVTAFRAFVGKPLARVTLADLQAFADALTGSPRTRAWVLSTLKSLFTFASKIGATPFNVGAALRLPKVPNGLAARILSEEEVSRMLVHSTGRDHALLRLAYGAGVRVSELVTIRWADLVPAADCGAFLTVVGKGSKARTVPISPATWLILADRRGDAPAEDRIFPISRARAWEIVRAAARRAGIDKPVSPHFLRHANASHALERGCPICVVRDSLGHASIATTNAYLHARPGDGTSRYLPV